VAQKSTTSAEPGAVYRWFSQYCSRLDALHGLIEYTAGRPVHKQGSPRDHHRSRSAGRPCRHAPITRSRLRVLFLSRNDPSSIPHTVACATVALCVTQNDRYVLRLFFNFFQTFVVVNRFRRNFAVEITSRPHFRCLIKRN